MTKGDVCEFCCVLGNVNLVASDFEKTDNLVKSFLIGLNNESNLNYDFIIFYFMS